MSCPHCAIVEMILDRAVVRGVYDPPSALIGGAIDGLPTLEVILLPEADITTGTVVIGVSRSGSHENASKGHDCRGEDKRERARQGRLRRASTCDHGQLRFQPEQRHLAGPVAPPKPPWPGPFLRYSSWLGTLTIDDTLISVAGPGQRVRR